MNARSLLVVDDDLCACERLSGELSAIGFRPSFAHSWRGAVSALCSGHFDAVLLDESLAHREGQYLIAGLREHGHNQPVLIMSPMADQLLVDWVERGASDIITKPTPPAQLKQRLASACARPGH